MSGLLSESTAVLAKELGLAERRVNLGCTEAPDHAQNIDHADCIVVWGSQLADAHRSLFERVLERKNANPALEFIVIGAQRSPSAESATLYVPVWPGGEVALLNAVARRLIDSDTIDHRFIAAHTTGFDDFFHFVTRCDFNEFVVASGVSASQIRDLAKRVGAAKSWLTFYSMGLNQSNSMNWKNRCMNNLHLLTGQIDKVGAGAFNLTGRVETAGRPGFCRVPTSLCLSTDFPTKGVV